MPKRRLIVTHYAPDLDAIGATWILKRFDPQTYGQADVAFVNPGEKISLKQTEENGYQLHEVTHVDTGLGKFDHHQPERANQFVCAASLAHQHVCQVHPEIKKDQALQKIVNFINEIDHFQEINWPTAENIRYSLMLHELIRGYELTHKQNNECQMKFGLRCLDFAYAAVKETMEARDIIDEKGQNFEISHGPCLALETSNDETMKVAQKQGYILVVRKDPNLGHARIKIRPDTQFDLKPLHNKIIDLDKKGTWFYHQGGKMLLNGSAKKKDAIPTSLSLEKIIELIKETYA
ncbi:MAG: hypothetical protein GF381_04355 [Candidatus Pacebacteria bacterium]|nr:hypothetical protein [Candidatus Paceibacterota bacterium]